MGSARPGLGAIAVILLAGSLVMLWFVILSGVTRMTPLDRTWFMRADTSGITGARPISQWTYFYICGDGNDDCGRAWADPPLGWAWSGNPSNAPEEVVGSHGGNTTSFRFFCMWRFGWVFFLLTLFSSTIAFFTGFLACFGRLGSAISGLMSMASLFFYTIGVSLMTATFVQARDAFQRSGRYAEIGSYAFGFSWASWAALFLSSILFCIGTRGRKDQNATTSSRRGWRRRRSIRSRRSHDLGNHRVKDEYS